MPNAPTPALTQAPAAFGRDLRLLRPAEFKRVFADACRAGNRYIVLLAKPNRLGHPRLGMAIARKHARKAVSRNRIKRLARESFRARQGEIGALDVVVLARPGIDTLDRRVLRSTLDRLWRELAARCNESCS